MTSVAGESILDCLFIHVNILDLKYVHLLLNMQLWVNPVTDKHHTVTCLHPSTSGMEEEERKNKTKKTWRSR